MMCYPKYKESGVEWIGSIPKHWKMVRSKHLFGNRNQRGYEGEPLLSVTQDQGVLPRNELDYRVWNPDRNIELYKLVMPGDWVISLRTFEGGIELSEVRGIVSPAYTTIFPRRQISNSYFKYLLKSINFIAELNRITTGIRQGKNISYEDFSDTKIAFPPLSEQKVIGNFLDRKTEQIDGLIRVKERRIELLQEQRTALINQAVTRGLDPNVEMKPSGVEWIREIPRNWRSSRLKFHLSENSGGVWGEDDEFENGTYVLRSTEITIDGHWDLENVIKRKLSKEEAKRFLLKKGDLIVTKSSGSQDHIGKTGLVDDTIEAMVACYSNFVQRLRSQGYINSKFLHYFMNCSLAREQYKYQSETTTGLANLNAQSINELFIAVPSEQEQSQIVNFLDRETEQIDELISAELRKIELLKEYRQSLISEAVTGEIDVRNGV